MPASSVPEKPTKTSSRRRSPKGRHRGPPHLFDSGLDGNVRRAIDIRQRDDIAEAAPTDHVRRAAVAFNLKGKS
jgi:hypothetical protein